MDNNTKQNDQTKLYALAICEMRTMDGRIIATNPKKKTTILTNFNSVCV